jgi:hypothetical protein
MALVLGRRGFIAGLLAAPAIVRAGSLMPVKALLDTPAPWLGLGPEFVIEATNANASLRLISWGERTVRGQFSIYPGEPLR